MERCQALLITASTVTNRATGSSAGKASPILNLRSWPTCWADEVGREATALVPNAVERLIAAGLAHRVSEDLVVASWRGMRVAAGGN
jgi:hypothetical protein